MCKSKSLLAALTAAFLIAGTIAVPSRVYAQETPAAEDGSRAGGCRARRADIGSARCGSRSLHQQRGSHAGCGIEGQRSRSRPQRLADGIHRAGAFHDASWPRAFLRRAGAGEERSLDSGHVHGDRRPGDDSLVAVRLQPHLWRSQSVYRGPKFCDVQRHVTWRRGGGLLLDLGLRMGHVPTYLRDHYAGPYLWRER